MDVKNLNLEKYRENILFIPIGGSNEIGLNCNLYHYRGKWLVVDCGVGFSKLIPGVEILVPDTALLRRIKKDILAMFITHIHEDHIGAVQYLWPELEIPIFASKFAKLFLMEKLREYSYKSKVVINEVNNGDKVNLPPFEVELIGMSHSVPEMNALLIKTDEGNILHSGDWKFDPGEQKSSVDYLKRLGSKKEILAVTCESTNIFSEPISRSENELYESFYDIVKNRDGLVIFTTFASNVSRIKTICDVAKKTRRKVVLVGSSLLRLAKVARTVGYLEDSYEFLPEKEIKNFKKQDLIIVATGCQGNANAGIDKLANDAYRYVRLSEGDCVIFSSRIIPGNERELSVLYSKFANKDVDVITEKTNFVHVSGHYCLDDLKKFYRYTKPKIAIAVHGEPMQLIEHQKVAMASGVDIVAKGKNGTILKISKNGVEKLTQIDLQTIVVDGTRLLSTKSEIIKIRGKIANTGIIFVNLLINSKYRILQNPVISAPGIYDFTTDRVSKEIFSEDIVDSYNRSIFQINETRRQHGNRFITDIEKENFISQNVRAAIIKICDREIGKKPLVEIFFSKIAIAQQH
ncbi:MAG: ribonuclease J [Rickettsiales bacterium]|jgi:ribonuclease J|nr:ribonuclease J [Rickettsiales bacterium]